MKHTRISPRHWGTFQLLPCAEASAPQLLQPAPIDEVPKEHDTSPGLNQAA